MVINSYVNLSSDLGEMSREVAMRDSSGIDNAKLLECPGCVTTFSGSCSSCLLDLPSQLPKPAKNQRPI